MRFQRHFFIFRENLIGTWENVEKSLTFRLLFQHNRSLKTEISKSRTWNNFRHFVFSRKFDGILRKCWIKKKFPFCLVCQHNRSLKTLKRLLFGQKVTHFLLVELKDSVQKGWGVINFWTARYEASTTLLSRKFNRNLRKC